MNQLSLLEDIDKKKICRLVVKELKNYKALFVRMKKTKRTGLRRGIFFSLK